MRMYIECFYADDSPILGNLDGQAVLDCVNYRRTAAYRRLLKIVKNPNWMSGKVDYARIVDSSNNVLSVIE